MKGDAMGEADSGRGAAGPGERNLPGRNSLSSRAADGLFTINLLHRAWLSPTDSASLVPTPAYQQKKKKICKQNRLPPMVP